MKREIKELVDFDAYPLDDALFIEQAAQRLDSTGVLLLPHFIQPDIIAALVKDAEQACDLAYFTANTHNVYLTAQDDSLPKDHVYNRQITSSKGCVTTDQVPASSALHQIYHDPVFQQFICHVVGQEAIYPYADPLSSINIHYAFEGQELGWHFDNSSFAITLLLQAPEAGGVFEYVKDLRDADKGEMNFAGVGDVLDGHMPVEVLDITPGTLVLFRGRNAMHRVTPTIGKTPRFLVVLAYNDAPDIALSEQARMTFFGRLS